MNLVIMPPILNHKHHNRPSVFEPANLLREARRQKWLPVGDVPDVCVLDPDGDLSRHLKQSGARRNPYWACYHTENVVQGGVWTTDAPFRETAEAIAFARSENLLAVEMEAAALYALAEAKAYPIICFAHVTNQMGVVENDFEKGESDGNTAFVRLISLIAQAWRTRP